MALVTQVYGVSSSIVQNVRNGYTYVRLLLQYQSTWL